MANIERTRDLAIVSVAELQVLVKNYIESETGRKIDGNVTFSQKASDYGNLTEAYAHLTNEGK